MRPTQIELDNRALKINSGQTKVLSNLPLIRLKCAQNNIMGEFF